MSDQDQGQLSAEEQEQKNFAQEQAHGREVMAKQQEEIDAAKAAAETQKQQAEDEAAEQEEAEWEEAEWTARLNAAKNSDRNQTPNTPNELNLNDHPELKKKADAISKKIKEEKKKTGTEYFTAYLLLTVLAGLVDVTDLIFDICGLDIGIIITPIYATTRYLVIKYANIGVTSREHEKMNLYITLVSGAISLLGLPSNIVAMLSEFAARKKIADDAAAEMAKLAKERDKVLGPDLARLYTAPK